MSQSRCSWLLAGILAITCGTSLFAEEVLPPEAQDGIGASLRVGTVREAADYSAAEPQRKAELAARKAEEYKAIELQLQEILAAQRELLAAAEKLKQERMAEEKKERDEKAAAEAKQVEQLRKQAEVRLGQYRQSGWVIRDRYDDRSRERLLLLTSSGPIVIDLVATIDGKPYYEPFERMRAEMAAGQDSAQPIKWEEAIKNPRFAMGRFGYFAANEAVRKQYIRQYDADQDGIASAAELRMMLIQLTGGPPLMVQPIVGGVPAAPVMEIVDANKDGAISEEELAKVSERLATRDANDDEIVDIVETAGNNPNAMYGRVANQQRTVVPLDGVTDYAELRKTMAQRYGKEDRISAAAFRASPRLFAALDANADDNLDEAELRKLDTVAPFCTITSGLGKTGEAGTRFSVAMTEGESLSAPPAITEVSGFATLELPGLRLQLGWGNIQPTYNFDAQAQSMLNSYDTDKNGYLEKEEVDKVQPGIGQQFAQWDTDGDGKVFPAELKTFYERQQAPQWNRVSVGAIDSGSSLWELLDANADGRLSLREVRTAAERMRSRDKDGDGKLSPAELPSTFKLGVARGNYVYQLLANPGGMRGFGGFGGQPAVPVVNANQATAWFTRMDRNGDGDVSRREFLGTTEQFRQLDKNDDGFITREEAEK